MAVVFVSLLVPLGYLVQQIKNLKSDSETELKNFDSAASKNALKAKPQESVEAHLKKDEDKN